ncbi:MucBP domain-containing protein [Levilactobacillus tangyuanensis]|uniref:MucBP domain-containing protein n=1 Tax=Levilactobacillus tangyuanensis TaxID=2486021 RepID=A0ABW1TJK6_9LACO|nr:MucBP domain-containing protein [Levilactobacillus tangyuanensis]
MRRTDVTGTYGKLYKHGKAAILTGIITTSLAVGVTNVSAKADEFDGDSVVTEQEKTGTIVDEQEQSTPNPETSLAPLDETASVTETITGKTPELGGDEAASPAPVEKPAEESSLDRPVPTSLVSGIDGQTKQAAGTERRGGQARVRARSIPAVSTPTPRSTARATTSIDEWMPDKNLQQLVLWQLRRGLDYGQATYPQLHGLDIKTVDEITPEMLRDNLYRLDADINQQYADRDFFNMSLSINSLKGLEYATNLGAISIFPDLYSVEKWDGIVGIEYGQVEDISALKDLKHLTSVIFHLNQITDISALANKSLKEVDLTENNITDLSPLKSSIRPDTQLTASRQAIYLSGITLGKDDNFVFDQITIKDVDGTIIPLEGRLHATGGYWTSDGTPNNVSPNKIIWSGFPEADGSDKYLFMDWDVPEGSGQSFSGEITQEFTIDPNIGREETATIHYNYADGKKAAPDKTVTGKYGQSINFPASPIISGYTASQLPVAKYGATKNEFTVTYTKAKTPAVVRPEPITTVTVHYQTLAGQPLADDQTLTGHPGESYTTTAVSVPGYTLIATPANATGTFGNADAVVNYYYEVTQQPSTNEPGNGAGDHGVEQPEMPAVVTPDPIPGNGGAGANIVDEMATGGNTIQFGQPDKRPNKPTKGQGTLATTQQVLPKTGEAKSSPILGLAIVSGLIGLIGWRASSRKN